MDIPKLQIGDIVSDLPIVQGGMGVRVSLASLSAAVANEGGVGTIASVGLGDINTPRRDYEKESREALRQEIRKAKYLTSGHLAMNVMSVLSNAEDLIKTAVEEGVRTIVVGSGLPLSLPAMLPDQSVNLLPIVSSGRAASLILRAWDKRYNTTAAGIILEGPLAGGHLGFSNEQLDHIDDFALEFILPDVLDAVKKYEDKYGHKIPIIAAGGIYTGKDIARMLSLGASGVQMGTRFVCTDECSVSDEFKQAYLDAKKDDIVITKSPVGLPGRAIQNRFLQKLQQTGKQKVKCNYRCLSACKMDASNYCIADALFNAYLGNVDEGLIFCGANAYRVDKIVPVKQLMAELVSELKAELFLEYKKAA
jgi:nitronate monooxygenase